MKFPSHWPCPDKTKPTSVQSRITEQQKADLYNRKITTRALATLLDCHEKYLSYLFPGKVPIPDKKVLAETRRAFKLDIARQILEGRYTIKQAADTAYTSYNTMQRTLQRAKIAYPHLLPGYQQVLLQQRLQTVKEARNARLVKAKTKSNRLQQPPNPEPPVS